MRDVISRDAGITTLGIVFPERLPFAFTDAAAVRFLQGLAASADERELAVAVLPRVPDDVGNATIRRAPVDGLIVYSVHGDDSLLEAVAARGAPTVIVDSPPMPTHPFVGIDDRAAAVAAVRHLVERGHRRLGVVTPRLSPERPGAERLGSVASERLAGCVQALSAVGVPAAALAIEERPPTDGRAAAHAILDRAPRTTAIFAFSDTHALGVLAAAADRGLSVPRDLSIIGFDDTAPEDAGLTTVHQPLRTKGRTAVELLLGPGTPAVELLPTRLVVRGSTAVASR